MDARDQHHHSVAPLDRIEVRLDAQEIAHAYVVPMRGVQQDHDDGDEVTTFKPLSFTDSDIYLIFYAFLLLLLGSVIALFIELLSDLFEIVEY